MKIRTGCAIIASILLSSCSATSKSTASFSVNSVPESDVRAEIIQQAAHLGLEDGYYFGEEPRNFKTAYVVVKPEVKADFALAYENMLGKQGENMLANWKSYVPYSKRSDFARKWWSTHNPDFNKQTKKMQILWIHEALLDGGELWWRSVEKLAAKKITSPAVLTHDEEQRLVFNYAESQNELGSLSTQYH
jgi:hypothetical protein